MALSCHSNDCGCCLFLAACPLGGLPLCSHAPKSQLPRGYESSCIPSTKFNSSVLERYLDAISILILEDGGKQRQDGLTILLPNPALLGGVYQPHHRQYLIRSLYYAHRLCAISSTARRAGRPSVNVFRAGW